MVPPSLVESVAIGHVVVPLVFVGAPVYKSAEHHVLPDGEVDGRDKEVDAEDDSTDKGSKSESWVCWMSCCDSLSRGGSPSSTNCTSKETKDAQDPVPGEDVLSVSPPKDEGKDECDEARKCGKSSKHH